jgi:hypothetical protein
MAAEAVIFIPLKSKEFVIGAITVRAADSRIASQDRSRKQVLYLKVIRPEIIIENITLELFNRWYNVEADDF